MKVFLGNPGLDTIKVSNFLNIFDVPKIITYLKENYSDCSGVTVLPKKATITTDHVRFTFGYQNKTKTPYINAEIKAGIDGKNVENMGISTASEYLISAIQMVNDKYKILIQYDWYALKISRMEMNCTFPIDCPFDAYGRVLQLVKLAAISKKGAYSAEKQTIKGALSQDTVFIDQSTITTRIYDKSEEVRNTEGGTHFDKNLMRVEFVLKTVDMVKSDMRAVCPQPLEEPYLCQISDQMVVDAYRKRFGNLITSIDKRLSDKLTQYSNRVGADKSAVDIVSKACIEKRTFDWIISEFSLYEAMYRVPLILDINDVNYVTSALSPFIWNNNKDIAADCAAKIIQEYQQHPSDMTFADQRKLYDEFRMKGKGMQQYEITMYC